MRETSAEAAEAIQALETRPVRLIRPTPIDDLVVVDGLSGRAGSNRSNWASTDRSQHRSRRRPGLARTVR